MAKEDAAPFSAELLDRLLMGRDPKAVLESQGLIGDLEGSWRSAGSTPRGMSIWTILLSGRPATIATAPAPRRC